MKVLVGCYVYSFDSVDKVLMVKSILKIPFEFKTSYPEFQLQVYAKCSKELFDLVVDCSYTRDTSSELSSYFVCYVRHFMN